MSELYKIPKKDRSLVIHLDAPESTIHEYWEVNWGSSYTCHTCYKTKMKKKINYIKIIARIQFLRRKFRAHMALIFVKTIFYFYFYWNQENIFHPKYIYTSEPIPATETKPNQTQCWKKPAKWKFTNLAQSCCVFYWRDQWLWDSD